MFYCIWLSILVSLATKWMFIIPSLLFLRLIQASWVILMWICEFQHHLVSEYTSSQFYYICLKIILVNLCLFLMGSWTIQFSSVQSLSCAWLSVTPWTAARRASLSITSFRSLLRLMSSELMMSSNHLILCHPLLLLPSIFPSIRVFFSESVLRIRWSKYWSFSFSISPSNEYSGLISFRIDWLDLLAV